MKALVLQDVRESCLFFNERIRRDIWQWTYCLVTACRGIFLHLVKEIMIKSTSDLSQSLFSCGPLLSECSDLLVSLNALGRGSESHPWQSLSGTGEWKGAHVRGCLDDRALDAQHDRKGFCRSSNRQ